MHATAIVAPKVMPFAEKSRHYQNKILRSMKGKVDDLFSDNQMDRVDDCLRFLDLCKSDLGPPTRVVQAEAALAAQLESLKLAEKNLLIPLLSHLNNEVNEDMILVFPSLEKRSKELLSGLRRKDREDKIDLQPISDFMYDYCR